MRCAKCRAENPEDKKFCGDCGAALENCCPSCGAENPPGKRFCGDCGAAFAASVASGPSLAGARHSTAAIPPTAARDTATSTEGERRHLTVLFSDLVGSTEIAGHLDAEDWREVAAQYQRTAAAAVTRFGGHVAKYLGDGLMVYFGWPEAHEDDAERAVRAGLALVDDVDALNERLAAEHSVKLSVRVGIQTGSVVIGHGGGEGDDVFGDAPNVASRVQSAAEPDSVMITAAVHQLVSGLFVVEDRGAHQLKGVDHPVRLYRVIQPTAARRGRLGATAHAITPLVGREEELSLLLSRWEQVREGHGQLALVMGEPGIGKSRLVEEFRARIKDDACMWVECAGEPLFQSTPFHAVTQILHQGLSWRGDESPGERVAQLERGLERAGLKLSEALPLIADLLNVPVPEKYAPLAYTPDQRRKRLLANLTTWVLEGARLQPIVMVIEDLHWVDPSTLELTQMLVAQSATTPLLLLCTARPEFRVPWPMRAHHAQITLSRLNDRHTREIVAGVVARVALTEDLIDAVVKRTDGVPLFAEELTRLILEREGGSVVGEIPATLHDSLTARLDRLGPAKEVAQIAAVIGREFPYELLQVVSRIGEMELQAALVKLADAELIYARGVAPQATYRFKHALIQDAAYEALLKSRRRELHERIGQAMESLYAERLNDHLADLVHQYRQAGNLAKAIEYLRRSGERATAQGADGAAIEQLGVALELTRKLPEDRSRRRQETQLRILIGPALMATKGQGSSEAEANYARALELCQQTGDTSELFEALSGLWVVRLLRGELREADALAQRLITFVGESKDKGNLAYANFAAGDTAFWRGDLRTASEHLGLTMSACQPGIQPSRVFVDDPAMISRAYAAWVQHHLGYPDRALVTMSECIEVAHALSHPRALAMASIYAGQLHLLRREPNATIEHCRTATSLAEEFGLLFYSAFAQVLLGCAVVQLGQGETGVETIKGGFEAWQALGSVTGGPWFRGEFAAGLSAIGRFDEALNLVKEAFQQSERTGERQFLAELHRITGMVSAMQSRSVEAEVSFRSAIEIAQNQSARVWELRATMSFARLLCDTNRRDEARTILNEIYSWFTEGFDTADLKDAKALLDELGAAA